MVIFKSIGVLRWIPSTEFEKEYQMCERKLKVDMDIQTKI